MAKAFTVGTVNQPDAGSVSSQVMTEIRDAINAHTAWDLVEEFTPASGAVRWYVFKNLASASGLSANWYLVIGRTIGTGRLVFFICETYDTSTKVCGGYGPYLSSPNSNVTFDAYGRYPGTYTLGTTELAQSSSTNPRRVVWDATGTATKYWLIVDDDGLVLAFNGAWNGFYSFGAYTWLADTPNALPICSFATNGSNSTGGATNINITRNPAVASRTTAGYGISLSRDAPITLGFTGRLDTADLLISGQRALSEYALTMDNLTVAPGASNSADTIGSLMGKLKRPRVGTNPPSGVAFGDAYVVDGTLWVPWSPSLGVIFDTGIAAS